MILFRADANAQIGTGHVMRCLSIAKAFAHRGMDVRFIVADECGKALIESNGFQVICLDSDWTDMESELPKLTGIVDKLCPDNLLVDSYYATAEYLKILSHMCRVTYIDDMNRECYEVDAIINYNIFANVYDYSWYKGTGTKLILGPEYAPLREEFKNSPKHEIKKVSDVLISAGGSDPEQITEKIMKNVCRSIPEICFHFVVGALNPRLNDIRSMAEKMENAVLHINEQHMADLMKNCDVAISAAGTTLYELCAVGIPTITFTLADNQLVAAEQFYKQGIMLSAGDCRGDDKFVVRIKQLLRSLIENERLREKLSTCMQKLVDGNGGERITDMLL